jgi:hypothetical protein
MSHDLRSSTSVSASRTKRRWVRVLLIAAVLYLVVAYLIIPLGWKDYARHHPSFDDNPRITQTSDGHPGDPLNVALIGTKEEVEAIMKAAKWDAAAALGLRSDLAIGVDSVLSRADDDAPVSTLYLFGRKEDLAFEQPVGDNPRHRHHVRFWRIDGVDEGDGSIWLGSASYDERVGLSHTTGQITHHIAPDVDKERDHLFADLKETLKLSDQYTVDGFHRELEGRNGGGDKWETDGDLNVGVVRSDQAAHPTKESPK